MLFCIGGLLICRYPPLAPPLFRSLRSELHGPKIYRIGTNFHLYFGLTTMTTHEITYFSMAQSRKGPQQKPIANGHTQRHDWDEKHEKTDYSKWRLLDESGRHTWRYLKNDDDVQRWPQSVADKYHLGLPTVWLPQTFSVESLVTFTGSSRTPACNQTIAVDR